jgi:hypothetical protein
MEIAENFTVSLYLSNMLCIKISTPETISSSYFIFNPCLLLKNAQPCLGHGLRSAVPLPLTTVPTTALTAGLRERRAVPLASMPGRRRHAFDRQTPHAPAATTPSVAGLHRPPCPPRPRHALGRSPPPCAVASPRPPDVSPTLTLALQCADISLFYFFNFGKCGRKL